MHWEINHGPEVTLSLLEIASGNSNNKTNYRHKVLLLSDIQLSKLCEAFANNCSGNIKLSKTELTKVVQLG